MEKSFIILILNSNILFRRNRVSKGLKRCARIAVEFLGAIGNFIHNLLFWITSTNLNCLNLNVITYLKDKVLYIVTLTRKEAISRTKNEYFFLLLMISKDCNVLRICFDYGSLWNLHVSNETTVRWTVTGYASCDWECPSILSFGLSGSYLPGAFLLETKRPISLCCMGVELGLS
jgi:hypothetical protein